MTYFNFERFTPDNDEFAEPVIEDFKELCAIIGIDVDNVYFSGFWSQGDGAMFTGSFYHKAGSVKAIKKFCPKDKELHRIAIELSKAQKKHFYSISGTIKHRGHYYHENCASFDFDDTRHNYGWTNSSFDENDFEQPLKELMQWLYSSLERSYEYSKAWNYCRVHDDNTEELAQLRTECKELIKGYKQLPAETPAIIKQNAIDSISDLLEKMEELKQDNIQIIDNFHFYKDGKSVSFQQFKKEDF